MLKIKYLFPHRCKLVGWCLLVPSIIIGVIYMLSDGNWSPEFLMVKSFAIYDKPFGESTDKLFLWVDNNLLDELLSIFIIVGGGLVAFSKQKQEDELTIKIRMESFVWSIIVNYCLLIIAIIFLFNFSFLDMMVYNMFTPLILFIIKFHWEMYHLNKNLLNEE